MNPVQLQRFRALPSPARLHTPPHPQRAGQAEGFGAMLKKAVARIEAAQQAAGSEQAATCAASDQESLYQAMTAVNRATVSFQLMTEFRNKALEAYQELMRMQV